MTATILIVDDEREIADLYSQYVEPEYAVRTAYSGVQAVEQFDSSVDVALLDRQMPDMTGREVLDEFRDRDSNCQIAMVTGIEPDLDVIDMPFDSYLTKPISDDELRHKVRALLARSEYEERTQDVFSLASKVGVLETELSDEELEQDSRYETLKADLHDQQETLANVAQTLDGESFRAAFHAIESDSA
jgi:DNA-binding response OmpR family regulator